MQRIFEYRPLEGMPEILWEDEHYVAINKPSGLLSNPGIALKTHDCALTRMQKLYPELYLTHRLDCDTSGILVFAKNKAAEGALKKQFQLRQVTKTYTAVVWGHVELDRGIIDQPIAKDVTDPPLQKIAPEGRPAITDYEVLERLSNPDATLVRLYPKTGRTHQLRVHMAHIGHPILGDTFYAHAEARNMAARLFLHAEKIRFNTLQRELAHIECMADFKCP